ncbi:MAG: hypothetical protein ABSE51_14495 [Terracidiphilus sp.]|jgi:hypothetical protein
MATRYVIWIALFSIVLVISAVVMSRPAFRQKPDSVVIRRPGCRFLGRPQSAQPEAQIDLDYALLSLAAYGDIKKNKPDREDSLIDANKLLSSMGWSMWTTFPQTNLQAQMDAVHLRAEVWSNRSEGSVVVAFGGTVFSSWKDWKSNLHWFNPFQHDEYSLVAGEFGREFADAFARQRKTPGWEFLEKASLYSTGHSLGGGLAEEFAYSLPANCTGVPRVAKVYAFDPSPVTGFLSIKRSTRVENKKGLKIDRIYERGEVLAILRSITSAVHKPPAVNPEVRQLRYNLFGNDRFGVTNSITGHSIQDLALGLKQAAAPLTGTDSKR